MPTCFSDIIHTINTCHNNFVFSWGSLWPGMRKWDYHLLYCGHWPKQGELYNKPENWELIFSPWPWTTGGCLWARFIHHVPFFHLKKTARLVLFCNCFFNESPQSGPYFLVNSRENSNSVWPSSFTPVEMAMKLGMCQSDEGTLILAALEGCPWGRLRGGLWLSADSTQHSLHLDVPFP